MSKDKEPAKISSSATEISRSSTAGPLNLLTFTIDGDEIYSSTQANDKPLYEISHKLDGVYKGHIIGLVRVDRVNITGDNGKVRVKTRSKHVYDVTRSPFWPHEFRIEGMRKDSYKKAYLRGNVAPGGGGLGVSGDGAPSLSARPPMSSMVPFKNSETLQWRDENGKVIAIETKREWVEEDKKVTEATKPKLQLIVELDEKLLDFLVVTWCTRNWKDARAVAYEPMTWEDFKRIARNTRGKRGPQSTPYADVSAVMPMNM
ncbi:hypothetical protein FQN54_001846 [Arachnomyces sp. PD_36]|nr:hypothetical protein FQN54_001846 [Arachnomyces sp. PD_36]